MSAGETTRPEAGSVVAARSSIAGKGLATHMAVEVGGRKPSGLIGSGSGGG
jgi:hypothetical protein